MDPVPSCTGDRRMQHTWQLAAERWDAAQEARPQEAVGQHVQELLQLILLVLGSMAAPARRRACTLQGWGTEAGHPSRRTCAPPNRT